MKITILNGSPESSSLDTYLGQLKAILEAEGKLVTQLDLRDLKIRYCIGCFGCWVKTPGVCSFSDDSCQVRRAVIQSDFTLWAAPLQMGFPSATLKMALDKSIPLLHPYFAVVRGEAHHRKRYPQYPRLGLLLAEETDTDPREVAIVADIFSRTALNMRSQLEFALTTATPMEAVANQIVSRAKKILPHASKLSPTQGEKISPPKQITIFNGSPRGAKGNTPILLTQFMEGFTVIPGNSAEMHQLNWVKHMEDLVRAFSQAECVWLGFPLYTDAMPGIVKYFIEALAPLKNRQTNPPIGFLVQSGFPEAAHSRHIERYLQKLADRLNAPYLGTIVKGSGEGIRFRPTESNRTLFENLQSLGRQLGEQGQLDPDLLKTIAKPESYPKILAPVFKLFVKLPIASWYWDTQLKENNVYEQCSATPYQD